MGCTPSKLDVDDTVRQCKDRCRFMKEAVYARHHLAAAHLDYCRSLRMTGSALVAFAHGEPVDVSDDTTTPIKLTRATVTSYPSPSPSIVHPPQPPPPLSTASSKPPEAPARRRRKAVKLPHILSDSSFSSSPPPMNPNFDYVPRAYSTYSTTPSQASSIWNWDNFYPPPPPPDSDYFQRFDKIPKSETVNDDSDHQYTDDDGDSVGDGDNARSRGFHHLQNHEAGKQFDDRASNYSSYSHKSDQFHAKIHTRRNSRNWESEEEDEAKREEVHCSEWGDHDDSSSTNSTTKSDEEEEFNPRSEKNSSTAANSVNRKPKPSTKSENHASEDDGRSSVEWGNGKNEGANPDRRIVLRHQNLVEIVAALREQFDKAAAAGDQVSEMLETGRTQLDRSFKQLRKTIYHSSGILSNLSSTWTSKPPLAIKYRLELNSIDQCGGPKGLCSTLERLLAWEKKLYQEVKAREGVKFEHEKKLFVLQSQEYRGEEEPKLIKTKTAIKRLQSLISVTSQAASTTSIAIVGLRDSDLIPQLVELCHGFMYMWRAMNRSHEIQCNAVQQVRGLINITRKGASTSDEHHQATRDLEVAISAWQSSFCLLIKFQRDFARALHGWFKLTLLPVDTSKSNNDRDLSDVLAFFDEWRLALDRVPDTVASEAIKSLNNVVHSIFAKQTEELKIKKRAEVAAKELDKKASTLRTIEKKYYSSYSLVGVGLPDDNGHVLDTRDPLAEKRAELAICQRRVEDEMVKHSKAVEVTRAMTLNNLQTGLPGVFHAMTSFSTLITEVLENVCTRSYAIQ